MRFATELHSPVNKSADDEIRCPQCHCPGYEIRNVQNVWNTEQSLLQCISCHHAWLQFGKRVEPPLFYRNPCPECGSRRTRIYSHGARPSTGKRWHKCHDCGTSFDSIDPSRQRPIKPKPKPKPNLNLKLMQPRKPPEQNPEQKGKQIVTLFDLLDDEDVD